MSHTKRIYNRKLKKAQRFNWDAEPLFNDIGIQINNNIVGIPFTRRSFICMGRCPMCRDPNREPKLVRKRRKEQFRFELKSELKISEKEECCHLPDDIDYDATICQYCLDCD